MSKQTEPDRRTTYRASRRSRTTGLVAISCAAVLVTAGCGSSSGDEGGAGEGSKISIASTPLSTTDILMTSSIESGLPKKYDVSVEHRRTASVAVLYQEFTAGRFDCLLTDPAVFAEQASKGLPATIVGTAAPNFSFLLARKDSGISSPSDLAGKRVVAATATGGYKFFRAAAKEWYDVDLDKDVEIVQAATDVEGLAQVTSGSADAQFTFETGITKSLLSDPDVTVIYGPAEDYTKRTGATLWQNVLMCRTDHGLKTEQIDRVVEMLADAGKTITDDTAAADAFAVEKLKADKGVYQEAFDSGRLSFDIGPVDEKSKTEMVDMIEFQQKAGTLPGFDLPKTYFNGL